MTPPPCHARITLPDRTVLSRDWPTPAEWRAATEIILRSASGSVLHLRRRRDGKLHLRRERRAP